MKFLLILSVLLNFLNDKAIPLYQADSVSFYQTGQSKYDAMLEDMVKAQDHIHCEYFIFANDSIAGRMLDIMKWKAKEGVKCRLVIDGYYDRQRGYNYSLKLNGLRRQGIEVYIYKPYEFPYIHSVLRDHRKIVVIDGKAGYTGGFNVADYNIKGKPGIYGNYVDTHVRLEGSCVEGLQYLFSQHFEAAGGEGFDGDNYYPYTASENLGEQGRAVAVIERGRHCRVKKKEMRRSVVKFIASAKDSLHITSPYLLPIPSVRHAIHRAIKKGVHVEILFSEVGDLPMLDAGNLNYAKHLQKQGAEIWLYEDGFQHTKMLTADGQLSMVGSVNLDSRAMRWNEEVAVIIQDAESAQWLDSAFVDNQRHSHQLTQVYYKNLPFSTRIKGFFANYFLSWCL